VVWEGAIPTIAPFEVPPNPLAGEVFRKKQVRPNPNTPVIDSWTRGVANAVVFLRGVDSNQGKRWDHPPVRVEQRGCQYHVVQGRVDSAFGVVRCGDGVELVSRDRHFHSLHAGGAVFFSLTFPDPDQPVLRPLKEKGIIELTSAAGYYWMRAYLFVDEHPYYARTDSEGQFSLLQVPPGDYEAVCWLSNWRTFRHERDPESGLTSRLFFEPPIKLTQSVTLSPSGSREVVFRISAEMALTAPASITRRPGIPAD
jgi:hypothetical protein